ncbi:MAG: radical SAM protein [Candidatus Omnitrophica bacterium]|nr:radical SAM protein [Candidatus Omnitrophota bacterium]
MQENQSLNYNLDFKEIPVPTFCCFTLSDYCFLECKMCFKWKKDIFIKPDRLQMELEDWKKCALSLRKFAPDDFVINFGGGEITTVPWLFDLIKFCHELGFRTNIATNAFIIDRAMVEKMRDSKLDYINISLDSLDRKTHDYLRGVEGVYDKVMQAIDLVNQYAPNTQISICSIIMQPTLTGMVDLVKWVQQNNKINMIYLMVLMQPNNTDQQEQWWKEQAFNELWLKDYNQAAAVLDELIQLKIKGYKICNPIEHLQAFKTYSFDPNTYVKQSSCNIDHAIHISSVGDMFMCYQHQCLGDVRKISLDELWQSEHAELVRKQINNCRENCHFLLNCNFKD